MKFNCIAYGMTDQIAIWEIEMEDRFNYYVQINDGDLLFAFGSYKRNDNPRFSENDLKNMFYDGYFDIEIGRHFRS